MTRLNKNELRIQLLAEVKADCEDLFSETELDLGSELEKLVDVIVLANKNVELGVILCGSGNGAQMTANKHQGIRAGLVWNNEIVELIRLHNNANVLAIPARFVSVQQALGFVEIFLNTEFEGGRHQNRIDKIPTKCC